MTSPRCSMEKNDKKLQFPVRPRDRWCTPVILVGYPIDEIPLFSNYSPCFHKIGYIQKIVYKKNNYLVKSMIEKSVYFYIMGRFFPGQGGRSLVESRSDFRPLFAGVGRSLVKV